MSSAPLSSSQLPIVVISSGSSWDGVALTERPVAEELVRHARVLWVDPPVSVVTPARQRHGASRMPVPRLRSPLPNLFRLTPTVLPLHTRKGVRATTAPLIRAQVRWALRRLGGTPHTVMDCGFGGMLGGWGPGVRNVLYGTDDFVAGAALMGMDVAALEEDERRSLAAADLVIAISPTLAERWRGLGARRVVMVPNGVRTEALEKTVDAVPAPDVDLPGPVVALMGHLSDRINIDLLEAVADAGCSLLVVGPVDPRWEPERFAALVGRPRVTWVGKQPHEALAGYLRHADVGIVPYRDTAFNRASFPLKMLEYLAAGLPPVCTDLPAARWLDTDLLSITPDEPAPFVAAVLAATRRARTAEAVAARQEFARRHTWRARAAEMARAMELS